MTLSLVSARAAAQLRRETEPVMVPPVSVSAPDGPYALAVNPAALTAIPSWSLAYVHASGPNDDDAKDRGDAGYAALRLPLGFAAALSVEHTRGGPPYAPATHAAIGGAWGRTPRLSLGFAVRHIEGGTVDGATTLDLAMLVRRSRFFAFSLVGNDVFGPAGRVGLNGLTVPAVVLGAFSVRPHGDDYLTLEGFGAVATDGRVGFGGLAAAGLPRGGRIAARATVEHFRYQGELRVVMGAELPWDFATLFGGAIIGDGYQGTPGWYAAGVVGPRPAQSLPGLPVVAEIRAEFPIDARAILGLVAAIQRAAHDPRVRAVYVDLDGEGLPLAYAQEVRQAIAIVRAADKPVVCRLGSARVAAIAACAGASRTLLAPSAGLRLAPPEAQLVPLAEALDAAGAPAEVIARGVNTPDGFARNEADLDADLRARVRDDLARSLRVDVSAVDALLARGELDAAAAIEARLVASTVDDDELDDALEEVVDGRVRRRESLGPFGPRVWARPRRVGVVVLAGTIAGDAARRAVESIERLARSRSVGAIVVRLDSAGGTFVDAELVAEAVAAARDRKPILASLGAEATSGAYLVAAECDEIVASPATLTGGLEATFARAAPEGDDADGADDAARRDLERRVVRAGELLRERVATRRDVAAEATERLANGDVVTGDEAVRVGLVDRLGGFATALARARALGRVAPHVEVAIPGAREPASLADAAAAEGALAIPAALVVPP